MFKTITASSEIGLIARAEQMGASRPFARRRNDKNGQYIATVELKDDQDVRRTRSMESGSARS